MLALHAREHDEADVTVTRGIAELTAVLGREQQLVDELRAALTRQRDAVAGDDPDAVDASVHALGRTLLTLEEARRRRSEVVRALTGRADAPLGELEQAVGGPLPEPLVQARRGLRDAAMRTAHEVRINQHVLRRALEAGDAFLQQLFAGGADPSPAYGRAPRATEAPARLLDRTG